MKGKVQANNLLDNNQIKAMRALAIIGVVTAHGTAVPDTFSPISIVISMFIQSIGSMGVGIFFFLSGYLMATGNSKRLGILAFLKKKALSLGVPWLVSSVLVYLYVAVRKGGSVKEFLFSIVGYGSSYWFMTVLVILMIVNFFILKSRHRRILSFTMIILSIISVILRWRGIIPENALGVYMNIFNWSIFFSFGVLYSEISISFINSIMKFRWLIYILVLLVVVETIIKGSPVSYFTPYYILFEIAVILSTISLGFIYKDNKYICRLGEVSFAIYLWHELPWAGLVRYIGDRFDIWPLVVLRPILVLTFTCIELKVGYCVFKRLKKTQLFCKVSGYRE